MPHESTSGCPIRRWRLGNFKSVEEADLELAPLTVLVGANSSGKSSLLQSILLISQAAQEGTSSWLPLNGSLVELGDIQDVIFAGKASSDEPHPVRKRKMQFRVGAEFDLGSFGRNAGPSMPFAGDGCALWEAEFGPVPRGKGLGVAQLAATKLILRLGGADEDWSFETTGTRRKELELGGGGRYLNDHGEVLPFKGKLNQHFAHGGRTARYRATPTERRLEERKTAGLVQSAGVPTQFLFEFDRTQFQAREVLDRLERESFRRAHPDQFEQAEQLAPQELKKAIAEVARSIVVQLQEGPQTLHRPIAKMSPELARLLIGLTSHQKEKIIATVQKAVSKGEKVLGPLDRRPGIPSGLERLGFSISSFMARNVRYLGPLREDPRIVYLPTPGEREGKVGKKGEKAVALLHAHGEDEILCFDPDRSPYRCTLAEGVKHWLHLFGIAEAIDTELRPRLGLEPHLNLPDVDRSLDMTAVGVGVSQIFPVLVMGLHSPPGSVLLMEQPELHLHPALQQKLGDFLLACSRSGRQLIVETHSDHLISRLRRRIAEDESNELQQYLAVIFAERHDGRTSYRRVEVNRYGGIDEWPQGFFDQAAKESQLILRAGLAKKKQDSGLSR